MIATETRVEKLLKCQVIFGFIVITNTHAEKKYINTWKTEAICKATSCESNQQQMADTRSKLDKDH